MGEEEDDEVVWVCGKDCITTIEVRDDREASVG